MTRKPSIEDVEVVPGSSQLLTVSQVAERLNVSERNVRHQIFQKRLGIVKLGRLVRIDGRELEEFIDKGRVPGNDRTRC